MDENADWYGLAEPPSSPPSMSTMSGSQLQKQRKPPPITPRRFTRFFTPRSSSNGSASALSKSGRQLRDITRNGGNAGRSTNSSLRKRVLFEDIDDGKSLALTPETRAKRRKISLLPSPQSSSPAQSSPIRRQSRGSDEPVIFEDAEEDENDQYSDDDRSSTSFPRSIRRSAARCSISDCLSRSLGMKKTLKAFDRCSSASCWQDQTVRFFSLPAHKHSLPSPGLPFSVASGNSNDLVAVGDESGLITMFDSSNTEFRVQPSLNVRSHANAVLDIVFSPDDTILATASGDQTTHIIDIPTSKAIHVLRGHSASVKQVKFQPNNYNVLATSGRDGSVKLWDLRCRGNREVLAFYDPIEGHAVTSTKVSHQRPSNCIPTPHAVRSGANRSSAFDLNDRAVVTENVPPQPGDVSVTAIEFLNSGGRENLLITGSSVNTSVRLWDIRTRHKNRGFSVPLSSTQVPQAHTQNRGYGINAMQLNTDESRLYALNKNGIIYAYSTNHLVLGAAPEIASRTSAAKSWQGNDKTGLGPIFALSHPRLQCRTFFVKLALRKAMADKPELLAAGSSEACGVLFPTRDLSHASLNVASSTAGATRGAASLVHGHVGEVTGLTWTSRGDLVTISDDYSVRMWTEDAARAERLRTCGDREGERWGYGWAEV